MSNEDSYSFVGEVEVVDDMCIISSSSSTLQSIILLLPLSTSSRYSRVALCAIDIDQSLLRSALVSSVVRWDLYRGKACLSLLCVLCLHSPKIIVVVALVDSEQVLFLLLCLVNATSSIGNYLLLLVSIKSDSRPEVSSCSCCARPRWKITKKCLTSESVSLKEVPTSIQNVCLPLLDKFL